MDIRSMVNSEDTPSPRRSSTSTPAKPDYRPSPTRLPNVYEAQAPAHDARRDIRPPQPSPLQTQGQNDFTFRNGSAYPNTQSSYQQNPSPGLRGGHISPIQILNQSPSHGHQTPQYSQRESCPGSAHPTNRSFSHSTPLSQTPTASTPGSANGYATFQRPSSSHSITTPISTQHPPSFLQEYPQPAHHQLRTSSQSHNGPQYMSQPSTPLGPPSINARSNLNIHRGSPGEYDQQRTLSGGSHGQLQATTPLSLTARSPQDCRDQHSLSSISGHRNLREPERSESVSPRTRLPSLPQVGSIESFSNQAHPQYGPVTPAKRKAEWDEAGSHNVPSQLNRTPSLATSIGVNGLFNAKHLVDTTQRVFREQTTQSLLKHGIESEARLSAKTPTSQAKPMYQPHLDNNLSSIPLPAISRNNAAQLNTSLHQTSQSSVPPRTATKSPLQRSDVAPSPIKSELSTLNESSGYSPSQPANEMARATKSKKNEPHQVLKADSSEEGMGTSSQPARKKPRLKQPASESMPTAVQKSEAETSPPSSASTLKPRKRTPRVLRIAKWQEIPVYAQSVKGTRRTEELFMLSQQRAATGQGVPPPIQIAEKNPSHIPGQKNGTQGTNDQNVPRNNVHVLMDQPAFGNNGPLGHWEPSMLGVEPAEELPTIIMDFLYQQIMSRRDVGVGPAGGAAKLGAIFEIEAKIGQLIDQNTNERLVLPVLNECVVNHNSNLRVKFQSSMTEVCPLPAHPYALLLITVSWIGPASPV